MLKVAVVGVGGISGAHIPVWEAMEDAELVALCDINQERLDLYPGKRGYLDFEEMLEKEKLDIIDICLPTYLHAEYSIRAMEKGIHVICEKPIDLKQETVAKVYETARKNNVNFMVAQVLRFWPEYAVLKDAMETQKYGRVISGYMCRLGGMYKKPRWYGYEELSGLVPYDLHVHDLDFMVYCFGVPSHVNARRIHIPDEQDCLQSIYEYPDFFINIESAGYKAPMGFTARFRIQFENALIVYENNVCTIYEPDGKSTVVAVDSENGTTPGNLPKSNAYANEIIYFAECVKAGVFPDKVKEEEVSAVIGILENEIKPYAISG